MPQYTFNCKRCGKQTTKYWNPNIQKPMYCSRECWHETMKKREVVSCQHCSVEFEGRICDDRQFCSKECADKSRRGDPAHNQKSRIRLRCQICSKQFERLLSQLRRGRGKYCSRECLYESRRRVTGPDHPLWTRQQRDCEFCGKTVWVKPAKLEEFRFCSRECQGANTAKMMAEINGPTSIELLLMEEMNRRGLDYRQQHTIANWVIDFTFPEARLAVEADGDYWHSNERQQEKDANKNRWLRAHKWEILRFSGSQIRGSVEECVDKIENHQRMTS